MTGLLNCFMLDKNPIKSLSTTLLTIAFAAEYKTSMSIGDPQNCIDPLPNSLSDMLRLTYADGLMDSFVDPWVVMEIVTPNDLHIPSDMAASILMDSGVITRWTMLVFVAWIENPNSDELMLHVEQTESIPSPNPWSYAALHTSHRAHLPLISLSGFTTVEWVVMDMGSNQSNSSMHVSWADLTLMLFPLMNVLSSSLSLFGRSLSMLMLIMKQSGRRQH